MNVVLAIHGREAIPVRALPFVAGREPFTGEPRLSAHIVALAASQADSRLLPGPVDLTMRTYQFERGKPSTSVSPSQWGVVVEQIEEATDKGETALIRLLPDSVFVWLDEFEVWYLKLKGPEDSGEICLTPIVPSEMRQVVLDGFPSQPDAQKGGAATIDYSPYLHVCEDGRIWWPLELAFKLGAGYVPVGDDVQNLNPVLRAPNGAPANERELLAAFHSQYSRLSVPIPLERDDGRFVDAAAFLDWLGQYVAQNQAHIEYPNSLAGAVRKALRQAHSSSDQPANEDAGDPFATREFLDGFEAAGRRINGLQAVESRIGPNNLSHERCHELASKMALNIADWIELTGIGEGHFGFYIVSKTGVRFLEWKDEFIGTFPAKGQMEMRRNNEAVPLAFPCLPAELLAFVDTADLGGKHFEVSDDFRRAVVEDKQQRSDRSNEALASVEAAQKPEPWIAKSLPEQSAHMSGECGQRVSNETPEPPAYEAEDQPNEKPRQESSPEAPAKAKAKRPNYRKSISVEKAIAPYLKSISQEWGGTVESLYELCRERSGEGESPFLKSTNKYDDLWVKACNRPASLKTVQNVMSKIGNGTL